jgi:hypothetical protein
MNNYQISFYAKRKDCAAQTFNMMATDKNNAIRVAHYYMAHWFGENPSDYKPARVHELSREEAMRMIIERREPFPHIATV